MSEAEIKITKSYGSVWRQGDFIAGFTRRRTTYPWAHDEFSVVLCVEPRELGPRGGIREPARMATITGASWASICRAVRSLGFTKPALTASEVRRG